MYDYVQEVGQDWVTIAARMTDRTPRQCADRWRRFGELIQLEKQGKVVRDKRRRIGVFSAADSTIPSTEYISPGTASLRGTSRADYDSTLRLAASSVLFKRGSIVRDSVDDRAGSGEGDEGSEGGVDEESV